jgi:hypothetical protein
MNRRVLIRIALFVLGACALGILLVYVNWQGRQPLNLTGDAAPGRAQILGASTPVSFDNICCCPRGNQPTTSCNATKNHPYTCLGNTFYCAGSACSSGQCGLGAACQLNEQGCQGFVDTCADGCAALNISAVVTGSPTTIDTLGSYQRCSIAGQSTAEIIFGAQGVTGTNGTFKITTVTSSSFTIPSTSTGSYTGGGFAEFDGCCIASGNACEQDAGSACCPGTSCIVGDGSVTCQ